ncbi:MAG: hypothetical protein OXH75_29730 [Acidobacteria bacterium]|nr:hypothetical protein [Acidobacteriota bacterium]
MEDSRQGVPPPVVLDTLKVSRELTAAGFGVRQADAIVEAVRLVAMRDAEVDTKLLADADFNDKQIDAIEKAVRQGTAAKTARTFTEALHELFSTLAGAWNKPLSPDGSLSDWKRRTYAFSGSMPWFIYNLTPESVREAVEELGVFGADGGLGPFELISIALLTQVLLAAWFAWLIAYQKRRCSPSRFFIEGLLFPGVAAALIETSILLELFGFGE